MLLSTRLLSSRTALPVKRAFGRFLSTQDPPQFTTITTRTDSLLGSQKGAADCHELPRADARNLVLLSVEQRSSVYSGSAALGRPKLPQISGDSHSHHPTDSWVLPGLAVKAARVFFEQNARSRDYQHTISLKSLNPPVDHDLTYFISTKFTRNDSSQFAVNQDLGYTSIPFRETKKGDAKVSIESTFVASWLSSEGSTTLNNDDLDLVAERICGNRLNLFEPLEAALAVFDGEIGEKVGFRAGKAVDMCYDVLEGYNDQQQPWKAKEISQVIIDKLHNTYIVKTPAHHLGQQYVRNGGLYRALVALGSNIGDRMKNIEQSLQAMSRKGIKVRSTSFLYETEAMYYENQDLFLNGVCEIETSLEPLALLDVLQQVEDELGRVKLIDKGPRSIDLDILLYDFDVFQHPRLQIPHKLMLEREFVLRPLTDIITGERLPPPYNKLSTIGHLEKLEASRSGKAPAVISSFGSRLSLIRPNDPTRRTRVMAVLNVTPDSFSDGGKHRADQLDAIEVEVRRFIAGGASIIDVGGQSTRPGATRISWQEELERVRPVIERIRSMPEATDVAISVDTFYADVARGAIAAGADIINDVSGGMLDSQMLPSTADLQVTVVLMHMRGTPETMKDLTDYADGVIEGVARELLERVAEALKAGIPRWRIVLDPGIGFAKTQAQNLELLRELERLRQYPGLRGFPWLLGTSRKGFIGKITDVSTATERGWGTAATVTASIAGGADIVRVHDVPEMTQVVKMADAMYRVEKRVHNVDAVGGL